MVQLLNFIVERIRNSLEAWIQRYYYIRYVLRYLLNINFWRLLR